MKRLLAMGERMGGLVRRPQTYVAIAIPIAIPFLLAAVTSQPAASPALQAAVLGATPELRYAELSAAPTQLPEHSVMLTVEEGDTLDAVLVAGGLTRADSHALTQQFAKSIDLRRLRPGSLLRFHYDTAGAVDSVEMKINAWGQLDAVRNGDHFDVTAREAAQRQTELTVSASIDSSLYDAMLGEGEGPALAVQLVDVFQWDIDFFALKKGDSFSLVAAKKFAGDDPVGYGPIVAARFTHDGVTYEAFRSEGPNGHAGYYAANGTPLRKQFLRAPLTFTRITSRFSHRRFHPLLHYFRPHHGVDYGAPVGTPVMTTADGVVLEATRNHGEGNYVKIRHSARIETSYLHLSRFARGIKPGARVVQGQVIGYVGMTGLATGPHLDYRVSDNGEWLDPLRLRSITPDPLRGESLRTFRNDVARLQPRLATTSEQLAQVAKRRALF